MTKREDGPDQARSWAVAMAGGVINGLLAGVTRTTGLFYVSFIETYGVSRMEASMPFTIRNVVRYLISPVVGIIGQRYGARAVTFVGGILACLGISLCCFAPNVVWISILWGGIHGTGVGLGNTLFSVVINQYFVKYRATAAGFSLSGCCIGSLILPFAVEYMLLTYGLAGSLLITGGLMLHVLPAALLLSEPSWIKKHSATKDKFHKRKEQHTTKNLSSLQNLEAVGEGIIKSVSACVKEIPSTESLSCEKKTDEDNSRITEKFPRILKHYGINNPVFMGTKTDVRDKKVIRIEEDFHKRRKTSISIGEMCNVVPEQLSSEIQETSIRKSTIILLCNPMFYVISLSLAGFNILFDTSIIVDYIIDKGFLKSDGNYFLSVMSLGDLFGRLCFGWVTDKAYMTVPKFMLLVQTLQGVCFLLVPFFDDFGTLIAIIMIYGLASGATFVMYPILISKYLASVQSLAIGSCQFFTGVISLAIPPLIGYFRDDVGSYDGMFFTTGGISVVIGCLWSLEPLFVRLHNSHSSTLLINNH